MTKRYSKAAIISQANNTFLESVSIDCVVLAFHNGNLKILLNKFKTSNKWMLPGGFVYINEHVDDAANRILKTRVGADDLFVRQFHLFGDCNQTLREEKLKMLDGCGIDFEEGHWLLKRFVSVGYYALVKYDEVKLTVDEAIEDVAWYDLSQLPFLYEDHGSIIEKAKEIMRRQIGSIPLGFRVLPEKFTMPEFRSIYEEILGEELDRRNFQRKILSLNVVKRLDEKRRSGAHKSPYLYSFNPERYENVGNGIVDLLAWGKR